ncbi:MAG: phosphodiester glycosidase family protein [Oscillospiraceae bacterium]|nr:phosphodiester glycosidase family protein [Oscillospiraceae bacterium]
MFFVMLAICVAVTLLLLILTIKLKKVRGLFAVLTLLALLPTAVIGVIVGGYGDYLNYPGVPAEAVTDWRVPGDFGLESEEVSEDTRALAALLEESFSAEPVGEARLQEFSAVQTVSVTHLDTEGWLAALEAEAEVQLREIIQSNVRAAVYTADRTAYLDGIPEQAYDAAFAELLERGEDYLVTEELDVTLGWTPFGWFVFMDEGLVNAVEGFAVGEDEEITLQAGIALRLDGKLEAKRGEILENLPFIEKVFTIAQDALAAPVPDPNGFGSTDDPNEVLKVIEQAKDLIGDRTLSWSPEIEIKPGSMINYYYDESILVIQWKEFRNWSLATFAEVIVRDGSQIRRVWAGNEYRSWDWETPTQMSQRTNAVLGMSGDFYMFRAIGIVAYQGEVYRTDPKSLHHLFFTNSGEMLLTKSYEVAEEDAVAFVKENDVNFSLAFGPVIIENGEKLPMPNYLVGEFYDDYPRAAIGEVDPLHFIVMTVGKEGPRENQTVTLPEAQQYILEKGVHKAYSLDGGKTANMTFNGELTNDPRYREERTMSDMFYFASAIPEEER